MSTTRCGVAGPSRRRPGDDVSGLDPSLRQPDGDAADLLTLKAKVMASHHPTAPFLHTLIASDGIDNLPETSVERTVR